MRQSLSKVFSRGICNIFCLCSNPRILLHTFSPECVCVACGICTRRRAKQKRERHMRHRKGGALERWYSVYVCFVVCTKVLGQSDAEETVRRKRQSGKSSNLIYCCVTAALLLFYSHRHRGTRDTESSSFSVSPVTHSLLLVLFFVRSSLSL